MNLFKNLFHSLTDSSHKEEHEKDSDIFPANDLTPVDELFTLNFKKNGGKFLYCENLSEVKTHFEDILAENDWFESNALCFESNLFSLLDENRVNYKTPANPIFLFCTCENLNAEDGSIIFSSNQIRQNKPEELPFNIIVLAKTSQLVEKRDLAMKDIKKRYEPTKVYPTNIKEIKYFKQLKEDDFLQYGSVAKNLYLLLLEDL